MKITDQWIGIEKSNPVNPWQTPYYDLSFFSTLQEELWTLSLDSAKTSGPFFFQITITKLFTDQSEVSVLPAVCLSTLT